MARRLHILFLGLFEKIYYKVWQYRESFTNFKIIIIKCHKTLIQSDRYYKVRQNLIQSVTTSYYSVWQVLQTVTIITKWDIAPGKEH